MHKKTLLFLVLFLECVFLGVAWGANAVNGIRIWDSPDGTRLVFDLNNKASYQTFRLDKPDRIVIDLKHTHLRGKLPKIKRSHAWVKELRSGERKNKTRRFVIDTKGRMNYSTYTLPPNKRYGHRLVIELSRKNAENRSTNKRPNMAKNQSGLRNIIVAIDAGHGGEDPGAIGRHGTREKHITLTISRKLKKIIDKQRGMQAVLIRTGDYYISLRKRIRLARDARADMFISIHADAFRNPKVKGSSVYVLSERGATDEATKWLENQENSADLMGGVSLDNKDEILARVLLDLSQTATIEASTRVANNVLSEIRKIGPVHKKSVQYARFVVLKSPDIPSLLVETAFISNPSEEKRLLDKHYQNILAKSIFKGVKKYFKANPPPNTHLAELYAPRKNRHNLSGTRLSQLSGR